MRSFYKDKTVLVTGHLGFKGTWLCKILVELGAKVIGYGIDNGVTPSLYQLSQVEDDIISVVGDVRDYEHMQTVFTKYEPEIVFHLAAQPIVLTAYKEPRYTYETNVMGTVNLMECVRNTLSVRSVVNITTDKVYENLEQGKAFVEEDRLNGIDPYANSKSCSELVTSSYVRSFFSEQKRTLSVSTVRAGNVLGGGDFSDNRIVPDCVRAALQKEVIVVRNPKSIRPYQHVLEALFAYLMVAKEQYVNGDLAGSYNVGPDEADCVTSEEIVKLFCTCWGGDVTWECRKVDGPKEAGYLKLSNRKVKEVFGWRPKWNILRTMEAVVEWSKVYAEDGDIPAVMIKQIREYMGD
jgi:CDP-glucose 4,6-dehydratase